MRTIAILLLIGSLGGCKIERQPAGKPYTDNFNRPALGDLWRSTGGNYYIANGALAIAGAHNHPLWLKQPIPRDAVIDVDAWSDSPAGDIKLEIWGDGQSYARTIEYTATSYVFIFGGWHNQISVIARKEEHGRDRRQRTDVRVVPGRHYHFRIARKGAHIDWQIDGKPFLTFDDPHPLVGADHAYLGFNDWETPVHFDNLKITPN